MLAAFEKPTTKDFVWPCWGPSVREHLGGPPWRECDHERADRLPTGTRDNLVAHVQHGWDPEAWVLRIHAEGDVPPGRPDRPQTPDRLDQLRIRNHLSSDHADRPSLREHGGRPFLAGRVFPGYPGAVLDGKLPNHLRPLLERDGRGVRRVRDLRFDLAGVHLRRAVCFVHLRSDGGSSLNKGGSTWLR